MKNIFIIIIVLITTSFSYSQTEKGKKFLGGKININWSNSTDTSARSKTNSIGFNIAPHFGYFVIDNFAIGIGVSFGISSTNKETIYPKSNIYSLQNDIKIIKNYGVKIFSRYYFKTSDKFFFILNGNLYYEYRNLNIENVAYGNNQYGVFKDQQIINLENNTFGLNISPGFVYFVTPKIGIEALFGNIGYSLTSTYDTDNRNTKFTTTTSKYGLALDISTINLGINYYF